jgi:phosphohistidine phosphatase
MQLILLRHGIAAELHEMEREAGASAPTDADRPLTERGRKRLRKAARGLRRMGIEPDCVLHSGLVRARETAEIVVRGLRAEESRIEEVAALRPEADPAELFGLLPKVAASQLLCVGHAPNLDRIVALACGAAPRFMSALGKAGAACLDLPDPAPSQAQLLWLLTPTALRRLGK